MTQCKTATWLMFDWFDICRTVNMADPRLDVLFTGSPAAVRQVREQIALEIALDAARPEVTVARSEYYQHLRECERCRNNEKSRN